MYLGAKIGILGANGSGKSSLMRILAGVDQVQAQATPGGRGGMAMRPAGQQGAAGHAASMGLCEAHPSPTGAAARRRHPACNDLHALAAQSFDGKVELAPGIGIGYLEQVTHLIPACLIHTPRGWLLSCEIATPCSLRARRSPARHSRLVPRAQHPLLPLPHQEPKLEDGATVAENIEPAVAHIRRASWLGAPAQPWQRWLAMTRSRCPIRSR
jgi:energy-coupling factor transporter ATP-binding protein EcfA2